MTTKDDGLITVAKYLQQTGCTTKNVGKTVDEIVEATGLGRRSVYNWINDKYATRLGITRTDKKKQPYTYFVDNETLVAYSVFAADNPSPKRRSNRMFPDDTRQAVYNMWTAYIQMAVEQLANPQSVVDGFATALSLDELKLVETLPKLEPPQKVVYGLALAFQNLADGA